MDFLFSMRNLVGFGAILLIRTFVKKSELKAKYCFFVIFYFMLIGIGTIKSTTNLSDFAYYWLNITEPMMAAIVGLFFVDDSTKNKSL